jgi:nitrogen fixation/metabolism regulation signal transduction histidine kinase
MKLEGKLAPPDVSAQSRHHHLLVKRVAAMKRMVDDFSGYAKTPPAQLGQVNLNDLVEEIHRLYTGGKDVVHRCWRRIYLW